MFMEFLYFPEDKAEYIPAFFTIVVVMVLALATMYLFYKKSKKDEKIIDEQFEMDVDKYRIDKQKDEQEN